MAHTLYCFVTSFINVIVHNRFSYTWPGVYSFLGAVGTRYPRPAAGQPEARRGSRNNKRLFLAKSIIVAEHNVGNPIPWAY